MLEARRTIVKSPPELWAELSDPESLAKHLEAFGEIRITRLDPESTVAWEGDRARGTVELSASGWGTKVTLTAERVEDEATLQQPLAGEDEAAAPPPEPEPEPPAPPKKRGFFARLFGRKQPEVVAEAAPARPAAEEPEAVLAPEPEAVAAPEPEVVAEAAPAPPAAEEPEVVAEVEPEVVAAPEVVVDEPAGEITVTRLADEEAQGVLDGVLDALGSAHHRPFSR